MEHATEWWLAFGSNCRCVGGPGCRSSVLSEYRGGKSATRLLAGLHALGYRYVTRVAPPPKRNGVPIAARCAFREHGSMGSGLPEPYAEVDRVTPGPFQVTRPTTRRQTSERLHPVNSPQNHHRAPPRHDHRRDHHGARSPRYRPGTDRERARRTCSGEKNQLPGPEERISCRRRGTDRPGSAELIGPAR